LKGGSLGHFRDRKAAVFVYARRVHPISLLVFRANALPWPSRDLTRLGNVEASVTAERGFNVIVWRRGELGYALVSDVDAGGLAAHAARLTRAP
jgi:anti-sigma factor RsiW